MHNEIIICIEVEARNILLLQEFISVKLRRDYFFSWSPSRLHLSTVVLHKLAHVFLIYSFVRLSVHYRRGDTIKCSPILILSLKKQYIRVKACMFSSFSRGCDDHVFRAFS